MVTTCPPCRQQLCQHRLVKLTAVSEHSTLVALNLEWNELTKQHSGTVSDWARRCPALAGAVAFDDVLACIHAAPDAALGALLQLGHEGEELAHRVVLQAMLGKAVRQSGGHGDRFDVAVAELWVAIAEYPLRRRPRSIAANLAWTLRRRLAQPKPALMLANPPEPTATETLRRARSLGLIDAETHRTLWLTYVVGLPSAQVGAKLGITAALVRYRCSSTLRRLAGAAPLLANDVEQPAA